MKLKNNLSIESQMQKYVVKCFYPGQLIQIRKGLEANVDVSAYAHIQYNTLFMELLRELMTFDTAFNMNDYVDNEQIRCAAIAESTHVTRSSAR